MSSNDSNNSNDWAPPTTTSVNYDEVTNVDEKWQRTMCDAPCVATVASFATDTDRRKAEFRAKLVDVGIIPDDKPMSNKKQIILQKAMDKKTALEMRNKLAINKATFNIACKEFLTELEKEEPESFSDLPKLGRSYGINRGGRTVGVTGLKGSGKSTVVEMLRTGFGFEEYSMAAPLKRIGEIFGFTYDELYGSQDDKTTINKTWGICSREFLQKFGTEICRDQLKKTIPNMDLGPSGIIWIKLFINYLNRHNADIAVGDIRFLDEAKALKNFSRSMIISIARPGLDADIHSYHASEIEISQINADAYIINDGTIDQLRNKVSAIMEEFMHN